jgi:2-methylaconitate cis-trans-isomerase PrpF
MTGALFPTGNRQDEIDISTLGTESFTVKASLVDAANPFVFVDSATMPRAWHELPRDSPTSLEIIEAIRREGAVKMGLARDTISAGLVRGTPKIAVLSPPIVHTLRTPFPDIFVASYSMGKVHPSFQLTGAVCLSAAVSVPGTIAAEISKRKQFPDSPPGTPPDFSVKDAILEPYGRNRQVTIAHSSGTITTGVKAVEGFDGEVEVQSVSVSRTARRLFEGNVLVNI